MYDPSDLGMALVAVLAVLLAGWSWEQGWRVAMGWFVGAALGYWATPLSRNVMWGVLGYAALLAGLYHLAESMWRDWSVQ